MNIPTNCEECHLCRHRKNVVWARGNEKATVMIVGEGPGEEEDECGLPFVGRSGKLLDKMLTTVGIDPISDVYITNLVKCRPPLNRDPVLEEIEACTPFLRSQIEEFGPAFIVTLGAVPMKYFLRCHDLKISNVRGDYFDLKLPHRCVYVPLFHPSYLLRSPSKEKGSPKWITWQDLKELKRRMDLWKNNKIGEAMEVTNDMWPDDSQ